MRNPFNAVRSLLVLLLGLSLTSCSSESMSDEPMPPTPNDYKAITLSRSEADIVESHNEFALKFYNATCEERKFDVSVSPLSMSMFLSIMANGAVGEARQEIVEALGFEDSEMDAVNTFNYRLINELSAADNTVDLALANSIWIDDDTKVLEGFINDNKTAYGAEIYVSDFANGRVTIDSINAWCSEKTNGVIRQFIGESEDIGQTGLVTYSATYFNGKWSTPFDKTKTKKRKFNNYTIEPSNVSMMNGEIEAWYEEIDGTKIVRLPYGNEAFELVLFVLEDNGTHYPESFLRKQTADSLNSYIQSTHLRTIDLTMPKFKIDFTYNKMVKVLKDLGIKSLPPKGDFSAMVEGGELPALDIQQKVVVSVDEKGTEAAAVTGNIWYGSAGGNLPVPETVKIVVDSPFEYLVRETSTKTILFIGSVHNITE